MENSQYGEIMEVLKAINTTLLHMNERMDAIETRLDAIETRLDAVEAGQNTLFEELRNVKARLRAVEIRIESSERKLEALEESHQRSVEKIFDLEKRLSAVESIVLNLDGVVLRYGVCLENTVVPQLNEISACYFTTFERYQKGVDDYEHMDSDIKLMKPLVADHDDKLRKIS